MTKTCIAFANGSGGRIIIGVDDKTKEVTKISKTTKDRIYDDFPNSLYDSTTPNLICHIYEKMIGENYLLIIEIPESYKKPCYITKEGPISGVYLRVGSNTRQASVEYIEELKRENNRIYYDKEIIKEDISVLDKEIITKTYDNNNVNLLKSNNIIKNSFNDPKKLYPTLSGILWFSNSPESFIAEALVICTRFQGTKGRKIIQTEEIKGDLSKQINNSFNLVKSWIIRDYSLQGATLSGSTLIPEEALREAIINAVIHRKYSIPSAVKIAVYEDHIEIFSPGGFPGLIDINNLGDGAIYLRNPNIAKIARKIGLIEKLGSGIKLIYDSCKKARLKRPEYNEDGDYVKLTFYFEKEVRGIIDEEEKILILLSKEGYITIPKIVEAFEVSRNTATRKLNSLVDKGIIVRVGNGPGVKYILKEL